MLCSGSEVVGLSWKGTRPIAVVGSSPYNWTHSMLNFTPLDLNAHSDAELREKISFNRQVRNPVDSKPVPSGRKIRYSFLSTTLNSV